MANVIEHRKFVCVEFGETNNNKYWQYKLFDDGTAETEWGRIGQPQGSKKTSAHDALAKMRSKTNPNNAPDKRYTEVKVVESTNNSNGSTSHVAQSKLHCIAKEQIKIKNPLLSELIDFLVDVNAHNIAEATGGKIQYDTSTASFQTPLGVVVPEQVSEARILLGQIADFIHTDSYNDVSLHKALNQYLRLIPHDVGRVKISPEIIFPDLNAVQKENDLLDGLESSFVGITTAPKKDKKKKKDDTPKVFNVEMNLVEDDKIISWVRNVYQRTRMSMHQSNSLSVKKVFEVNIETVKKAFEEVGNKIGNVKKLWHGTKASNLLSILRGGLIIPPASSPHCTGRMYGNGIYFSDISTKALNYAGGYAPGQSRYNAPRTFMFLADVAMGKIYKAQYSQDYKTPKDGYDSTFAEGGTSGVYNNEMIVYRTGQVNLVYLVEFADR